MSYRSAFLLLAAVFILQFSRILFQGEVIFPHDNAAEVASPEKETDGRISNRKFSDESSAFIPELANNLRSDRKAWLPTWNPHVQFGRPAYQISGLSRAYLVTNALSYLTKDPLRLYTALILLSIGLIGVFMLLLLRALAVHPIAAVFAAIGLALSTPTSYWATFIMFESAICWLTCLLWLVAQFTEKPSWTSALGVAFATYSILMTAYPQITILSLYIISAFTVIRVTGMRAGRGKKLGVMFALIGCATAGAFASLPVYLDLLSVAQNSVRLHDVADNFFLAVLPAHQFSELANFVVTIFDWSWLGNAIEPKYPLAFNGLSFTPVVGTLLWLSLFLRPRRSVIFWQLLVAICFMGTVWPPAYLFAIHHLGFGFSRLQLLIGGIVPGFILAALVVDAALRGKLRLTIWSTTWMLLPLLIEVTVAFSNWKWAAIDKFAVATTFLLIFALLGAIRYRSKAVFIAIALISVFVYGRPLILSRRPESIHLSSKLIDAVKAATPEGSRFAIADNKITALPPNEEALLGLTSIDSYDSLSSRQYQELTGRWSTNRNRTLGRSFKFLDPQSALKDPAFPLSNVTVILSYRPLPIEGPALVDTVAGIKLYRSPTIPIGLGQTSRFSFSSSAHCVIDISTGPPELKAQGVEAVSDFKRIQVTPSDQETLLFLSQQYHGAWSATSHRRLLRTVRVNDFYQGIVIPPFTNEVELAFKPFVLWSWIPQLFFVSAGALLFLRGRLQARRGDAARFAA